MCWRCSDLYPLPSSRRCNKIPVKTFWSAYTHPRCSLAPVDGLLGFDFLKHRGCPCLPNAVGAHGWARTLGNPMNLEPSPRLPRSWTRRLEQTTNDSQITVDEKGGFWSGRFEQTSPSGESVCHTTTRRTGRHEVGMSKSPRNGRIWWKRMLFIADSNDGHYHGHSSNHQIACPESSLAFCPPVLRQ